MEEPTGLRYRHPKMTRNRVRHGDIETLWNSHHLHMQPSRNRIDSCTDTRNGKQLFKLPLEFDIPGAENLIVSLPQKMTVPLKTINVMSRNQPRLQRYQVGDSLRAGLIAGNIETWVNAAVEKKIDWGELIGKLFLDGEAAVMVIPSLADWQHSPDFMDSLSADEYAELDDETQARYRMVDEFDEPIDEYGYDDVTLASHSRRKPKSQLSVKEKNPIMRIEDVRYVRVDANGNALPDERFWRDDFRSADYPYGRAADDPYYTADDTRKRKKFKENRKNTEKAFEIEQQHWLKDNLPFRISVVSAKQCLPIFDVDQKLKGLIIRRRFTRELLLEHNYVWEDNADFLVPNETEGSEVTLYEYWGLDADGVPYVSYSVNGGTTHFKSWAGDTEQLADAVIDLRKEFGLRSLPVKYCWGLHWETDDVAMKGVPFLWPVLGAITGVEALSTSILVHSYSTAFGSWGIHADPQIIKEFPELLTDNNAPRSFRFAPLTTTILPGRPYPLVHPGVGKDVKDLLQMLMTASSSMAPSDSVFGGSGATSGHDRALSREYLETSMNQVLDGALQAYKFIGEAVMEICTSITKVTGVLIPVYATVPVPQVTGNKNRNQIQREIIELQPEWIGSIYNLIAFYPKSAGENLAELQQLAQLHMQGLVTFREFREKGFGDENPAATLIEIYTDQYLKSDAGKTEIAQLAAEMMGADSEEEKQKLIDDKRLTPGGTPLAALPPELQALNTGKIPPGVDPKLFAIKLQGMLAHDAARQALNPAGPIGATGSIAQVAAGTAIPGQETGAPPPGPGAIIPPAMTPQGAPGPAGPAPGGVNQQAPTMAGMSIPSAADQALGGTIAGQMGTASQMRDDLSKANMGS